MPESDNDLLVMVPTRGRPEQCKRLLESFRETATCADLVFVLDPDDEDTYADVEWGDAMHGVLAPRGTLQDKLNQTAAAYAGAYRALMWAGDDHVFKSQAWDLEMLGVLHDMGGSGWVYPETRRRADVPEIWMCSSDVTQALGWFFNPVLSHFYGDNSVGELGKRAGLIRRCPQAVIDHLHYSVTPGVEHDEVYAEAEGAFGESDLKAFHEWRASQLANEVAVLRRNFSPDVAWVLSRIHGEGGREAGPVLVTAGE